MRAEAEDDVQSAERLGEEGGEAGGEGGAPIGEGLVVDGEEGAGKARGTELGHVVVQLGNLI